MARIGHAPLLAGRPVCPEVQPQQAVEVGPQKLGARRAVKVQRDLLLLSPHEVYEDADLGASGPPVRRRPPDVLHPRRDPPAEFGKLLVGLSS